jgi:hypothetical protein
MVADVRLVWIEDGECVQIRQLYDAPSLGILFNGKCVLMLWG